MSHGTERKRTKGDVIAGCTLIGIVGYGVFQAATNSNAFFSMANDTFQLTKQELCLLPCGILLFVAFWLEMKELIFKPYLSLLQEREIASKGTMQDSHAIEDEAIEIEKETNKVFSNTKIDLMKTKIQKLEGAKNEVSSVLREAQAQADERLNQAREQNVALAKEMRQELSTPEEELTNAIVSCFHIAE